MSIIKKHGIAVVFILLVIGLFLMEQPIFNGIQSGINLAIDTVLPSLFPFMIVSKLAVSTNALSPTRRYIAPVFKFLFRLPPPCIDIFIFSLIGGYPIGAVLAKESYNKGEISQNQLQSVMRFCIVGGPGFVIGGIGRQLFNSTEAGIILYISCIISSLICGIISGFFTKYERFDEMKKSKIQLSNAFVESVASASKNMLTVCSYVVVFSAIISAIGATDIPPALYNIIAMPLEVTNGAVLSASTAGIPLTSALIAFGGIAIHCQIFSMLRNELNLYDFFIFRLISSVIAFFTSKIIITFYSPTVSTFSTLSDSLAKPALNHTVISVLLLFLSVFMLIASSKEKEKIDFTCSI